MSDQVVSLSFGRETFATTYAGLSAFVVTPPFKRELPSKVYKRQGALQTFPASAHPEINGYLFMDTVRVPDGVILVLQCSHKLGASPILDAAVFLRTRSTGPMLSVHAALPSAAEATNTGNFLVFQGRADRLSLQDVEDAGVETPTHWVRAFMNEEEVEEGFSVAVLSPETAARPRLEAVQVGGETVTVEARRSRRIVSRRYGN